MPAELPTSGLKATQIVLGQVSMGPLCLQQSSHQLPKFHADQTQGKKHGGSHQAPSAEEVPDFSCDPVSISETGERDER